MSVLSVHSLHSKASDWDAKFKENDELETNESWDSSQDCKMYIRMAIETSLAVSLVAVVTIIVLATNNAYRCCEPQVAVPPPPDLGEIRNISSPDFRAIVALSGYLKFLRGDSSIRGISVERLEREPGPEDFLYLPLNLTGVELAPLERRGAEGASNQVLDLMTDCARLSFHLSSTTAAAAGAERSRVRVNSIDIEPSGQHSGYVEPSVVAPTAIEMGADESYVCPLKQEYPTQLLSPSGHKKRLVSIVFDVLCIEVHRQANQAALRAGQFAKRPHYCFSA